MSNATIIQIPINPELIEIARFWSRNYPLGKRMTRHLVERFGVGAIEAARAIEIARVKGPKGFVSKKNKMWEAARVALEQYVKEMITKAQG